MSHQVYNLAEWMFGSSYVYATDYYHKHFIPLALYRNMNVQIGLDRGILVSMLINFGIIFFLIKKYATQPIIDALEERKSLIKKLENADQEYDDMIAKAQEESQNIIKDASNQKATIISEAQQLAKQEEEKILAKAHKDGESILTKAQEDAQRLADDFEKNFEAGVKSTTEVVVKKLLGGDASLEDKYIDQLISEANK